MPSSIAARTSSQPPDWAAALTVATTTRPATSAQRPVRYLPSRLSPVRLADTDLISEEAGEEAAPFQQIDRAALLGDAAVGEHGCAVGEGEGGQPLGGDNDRAAREGGT